MILLGKGGVTQKGWHSIESYIKCPKKYQFERVRGIKVPLAQVPDHFAVGQLFHAGRARWFSLNFDISDTAWDEIKKAMEEAVVEQELPISMDAQRRALSLVQQYMDYWSKRPRPTPLAAEYLIGPVPLWPGSPETERTARLDDVSRYSEAGGQLCIGESKTTSTSVEDTVKQYELHGQTMLQALLWKLAPQGEAMHGPIAGIMMDVTKKPYGNDKAKFGRQFVPINDTALLWFRDMLAGAVIDAGAVHHDDTVRRNIAACTEVIGKMRTVCPYRDLCRYGRSAAGQYVLKDGQALSSWKPSEEQKVNPWE